MRYKLVAFIVVLQVAFFLGWSAFEQGMFDSGEPTYIRVKTMPIDPRDYLSGQYMILSYEFSASGRWNQETNKWEEFDFIKEIKPSLRQGQTVWIVLRPNGELYEPVRMTHEKPESLLEGQVAFKGRYVYHNRFEYGIEKYFFQEGKKEPKLEDVTVELKITPRGLARVSRLFENGKPW